MLLLPLCVSDSRGDKQSNPAPFASVVYAGHTISGLWCECGTPGCICEPGEQSARPISDAAPIQRNPKNKAGRVSDLDFGTGAILIALALIVWSRLRA
jgi:hypothetical protein